MAISRCRFPMLGQSTTRTTVGGVWWSEYLLRFDLGLIEVWRHATSRWAHGSIRFAPTEPLRSMILLTRSCAAIAMDLPVFVHRARLRDQCLSQKCLPQKIETCRAVSVEV